MNSNSPKNNSKNKAKSIGMLTAIAGSCLLSTVLIQTSASAIIYKLARPTVTAVKNVVNNRVNAAVARKADYRNIYQNSTSRVSGIKTDLLNKVTPTPTARTSPLTGTVNVKKIAQTFSTGSTSLTPSPSLTLKK